jgi:hypothetical protein
LGGVEWSLVFLLEKRLDFCQCSRGAGLPGKEFVEFMGEIIGQLAGDFAGWPTPDTACWLSRSDAISSTVAFASLTLEATAAAFVFVSLLSR